MKHEDYPALYRSADTASNEAQKKYLWLIRAQYTLLILSAVLAGLLYTSDAIKGFYCLFLIVSTALLVYMWTKKPETQWYACRALAESLKTSTWRYMMRAEPFDSNLSEADAKREFQDYLKNILDANAHCKEPLRCVPVFGEQITQKMHENRDKALIDRQAQYLSERIDEQRKWYVSKVKQNNEKSIKWLSICVIIQILAIVLVIIDLIYKFLGLIPLVEPLLVMATAAIGWVQIKKFNELASAYNITAHEIGIVKIQASNVYNEDEFSEFVNEAELAFSREHTQWVARQNN